MKNLNGESVFDGQESIRNQSLASERARQNGHTPRSTRPRHQRQMDTRVAVEERMVQVCKDEWYQVMPAQLGTELGLSLREALLVGTLWSMCNKNGRGKPCMPSQKQLAKKLFCDPRTLRRCVVKLEARGLIAVIRGPKGERKRNKYFVNLPEEWFVEVPESQTRKGVAPF